MSLADEIKAMTALFPERKLESGYDYANIYDYFAREAHTGVSGRLSDEAIEVLEALNLGDFKARQCWKNAIDLAMIGVLYKLDIVYIEGFATTGVFWVDHAWNEIDGIVVDLTFGPLEEIMPNSGKSYMRRKNRIIGDIPDGFEYFGAPVDINKVLACCEEHMMHRPVIDDWCHSWPMLQTA